MKIFTQTAGILTLIFLTVSSSAPASAQESTRQRTTGTYLPASAAAINKEAVVDNQADSEMSLDDGSLTLEAPAGVYGQKLRFTIRRISRINNDLVPSLKIDNEDFIGTDVWQLVALDDATGQMILQLDKKVKLTFRYLDDNVTSFDETSLRIRFFDRLNQKWQTIDTTRNLDSNTLTANVDQLSFFAITGVKLTADTSTGNTETSAQSGMPLWQKILIGLILLTLAAFGLWYAYQLYQQSRFAFTPPVGSIAGGSQDTAQPENNNVIGAETTPANPTTGSPAANVSSQPSIAPATPTQTADNKPADDKNKPDEEIWVNF